MHWSQHCDLVNGVSLLTKENKDGEWIEFTIPKLSSKVKPVKLGKNLM